MTAAILEFPPDSDKDVIRKAVIRALSDMHIKRGPHGEWDIPAVAVYLIEMMRREGITLTVAPPDGA